MQRRTEINQTKLCQQTPSSVYYSKPVLYISCLHFIFIPTCCLLLVLRTWHFIEPNMNGIGNCIPKMQDRTVENR